MNDTLPLFDAIPQPTEPPPGDPMRERRKAMRSAFKAADDRFKEEYERVVRRFAERMPGFTGEDVQNYYRQQTHLPQAREWRCVGHIYQKLIKAGVIVAIGYRARSQGSMTALYKGANK